MSGKIENGNLVTIKPIDPFSVFNKELEKGDIVLCRVKGNDYLHLIKAIGGERYQIGNNHGKINGWTSRHQIFGKVIKVES
jgi:hypothetical protein